VFALNLQWALKSFWAHPMKLLGGVGQVEGRFSPLRDSVNHDATKVHGMGLTCTFVAS
jgi:hypothetical protein